MRLDQRFETVDWLKVSIQFSEIRQHEESQTKKKLRNRTKRRRKK